MGGNQNFLKAKNKKSECSACNVYNYDFWNICFSLFVWIYVYNNTSDFMEKYFFAWFMLKNCDVTCLNHSYLDLFHL